MEIKYFKNKENNEIIKKLISPDYNYLFNMNSGFFARWGKTEKDDPIRSPFGPEILDVEIVKGCRGIRNKDGTRTVCPYCYKKNTPSDVKFMSLEDFVKVFEKVNVNKTVTQVALGVDAEAILNPDTFAISKYLRIRGVVPNGTVADLAPEVADLIVRLWGAVAVSYHHSYEVFKDTIALLDMSKIDAGEDATLTAINCHVVACEENYEKILDLFQRYIDKDVIISKLNAIVLLALKHCGRAENSFTPLTYKHFRHLVSVALKNKVPIGFDSCSCNKFLKVIKNRKDAKALAMTADPCESGLFSYYVNEDGFGFPCSFNEKEEYKFDILNCKDFIEEWWNKNNWSEKLLSNERNCPTYEV
jgi:MoaA/NifB/PqqE/SkfB family radical SAM enzyme